MTIHRPTAAVRESFGEAQQQAAAMVAGPPTPWNAATRTTRRSTRWMGFAAASVAAAGVAGWFAADWLGGPARSSAASVPTPPAGPWPVAPSPAAVVAPAVVPAQALPAALAVTRQSGVIRIDATNAALADAVWALAQATRTTIKGGEALAAIGTPVTLTWQGTDIAAAWDALLGRFASIGVSCKGAGCELWIVGVTPPSRAASAAPGMAAAAAHQATAPEVAQPPRPAARPEPPPPATDENTETN
jgi:hypothetical protein